MGAASFKRLRISFGIGSILDIIGLAPHLSRRYTPSPSGRAIDEGSNLIGRRIREMRAATGMPGTEFPVYAPTPITSDFRCYGKHAAISCRRFREKWLARPPCRY